MKVRSILVALMMGIAMFAVPAQASAAPRMITVCKYLPVNHQYVKLGSNGSKVVNYRIWEWRCYKRNFYNGLPR